MPEDNGKREMGYLEGKVDALKESIERIDENTRRIFERLDETAKEGHVVRIKGLEGRVGRIEKTGIGAILATAGMFLKAYFTGK